MKKSTKSWLVEAGMSILVLGMISMPFFGFARGGDKIYVNEDASGTQNGSSSHPYKTIWQGLDKAHDGDEVIVAKGTYKERIPKKEDNKSDFKNINTISVFQRVVSDGNKSIFLAEVIVNSLKTNAEIFKGKTSANGKWAANLEPGDYKVIVSKRDNISKEKKVFEQIIKIDGKTSVLELPNLVIN